MAVDDLRRSLAAAARKMSVYVWTVSEFVGAVAPLAAGSSPVGRPRPRWGSAGLRSAGRLIMADLGLGMLGIKTKTLCNLSPITY